MELTGFFDWKEAKITNWRKVLRIIYCHGFQDHLDIRGISAVEGAKKLLDLHEKDLKQDEIQFLRSLLV